MNQELRRNITTFAPLGLAGYVGWKTYQVNKNDPQRVAIVTLVVWLIAYFVIGQVIKSVERANAKPDNITVPDDNPGTGTGLGGSSFNPKAYTDRLKQDIYCFFCTRDHSIYRDLASMSNSNLMKVYNDWNDRYYGQSNETMIQAMNGEVYGNGWMDSTKANVTNIISRLQSMGAS